MNSYLIPLIEEMKKIADAGQAVPMKRYLKDQFEMLGVKTPERKAVFSSFIKKHGLPELKDFDEIIRDLWSMDEREFQYTANSLCEKMMKKVPEKTVNLYEYMITEKSWWDTVDMTAAKMVGHHFIRFPEARRIHVSRYRKSDNMWLRRTALLYQLHYKGDTDWEQLKDIINENLGSGEFFINKAIGWILREYSKTDGKSVRDYIEKTELEPLSRREGLKWLERQSS